MNYKKLKTGILAFFAVTLIIASMSSGCTREEKPPEKGMEEIQAEEGLPVTVEVLQNQVFKKYLTFFATLSGIKETTEYSKMGDRVVKLNASVGSFVKEGDVIIEFPLDNPQVSFEQAKAALDLSKKNYERLKALYESGDIAKAKLDGAETQYTVDKRNFEAMNQIVKVRAPISGQIVELYVKEGDDIGVGKALFVISQLGTMKAKFWASEAEVAQLKNGMQAVIQNRGEDHTGNIREISMAMDMVRKAFSVEAHFPNSGNKLKSGVTSEVKIKVYENPEAIVIQKNLLNTEKDKDFVYLLKDGKAVKQYVTIGKIEGINVEITEGLKPGDTIINCCKSLLEDGIKVQVRNEGE
jgi:membrane fusion protein (multidrug efflux system)